MGQGQGAGEPATPPVSGRTLPNPVFHQTPRPVECPMQARGEFLGAPDRLLVVPMHLEAIHKQHCCNL